MPQDQQVTASWVASGTSANVLFQAHRDGSGADSINFSFNYGFSNLVVQQNVGGSTTTLGGAEGISLTAGTPYTAVMTIVGTTLTVSLNGTLLVTDGITAGTGTILLFGQAGSAGVITFTEIKVADVPDLEAVGTSSGTATATAVGGALLTSSAAAAGTSTGPGVGAAIDASAGTATGTSTAPGVGAAIAASTGRAAGTSSAPGAAPPLVGTGYRVYGNGGTGGPIDYGTPIVDSAATTFSMAPIPPGVWSFGVRAYDGGSGMEERNTDAAVRVVIGADFEDHTMIPNGPTGLTARARSGGTAKLDWIYLTANQSGPPTSFDCWLWPAGSVDWTAMPTTVVDAINTPGAVTSHYSATLTGLSDGVAYAVGVRAVNAAGSDGNTFTAAVVGKGSGPAAVGGLVGAAGYATGE